ncbi:MAG: hypothetical protein AVDCRST_MAG70-129 [uncultured Thermomicrobiales bacterium]|uniref:Uncharacterized protein n=1 Tax=uncultured Thermomicrobiales bacterium TaxID=1645740 RepID=A0A6J4U874_9BACT|nr:MAG: hypothetical protein AVDCRST_MAG70-129 [uncultured Thermomicrobiales bacterium]
MGTTRRRRGAAEPRMGRLGTAIYLACLVVFAALVVTAIYTNLWWLAAVVAVMAIVFVYAGWFVLARAWRIPPAIPRRPVRRRG